MDEKGLRHTRQTIILGLLTFTSVISVLIGNALPHPTDPLISWMLDWSRVYYAVLNPWLAQFIQVWVYFFFDAIWYFLIAAVILKFKFKVKKSVVTAIILFPVVWLIGWLVSGESLPIPMTYANGIIIVAWSLIIFAVVTSYLAVRLLRDEALRDEIELRSG